MINCQFPTMIRSFLYVPLYRLSHYYYYDDDYYYYWLTGRFYRINCSYFEKHAQRSKKNPEQRSAKLQFKSDCLMLNILDRDTRFFCYVAAVCCATNMTVQKSFGLIFISVLLRE